MKLDIGTIVIIVLAITMLILGTVLIKNILDEPEFKITYINENIEVEEIEINCSKENYNQDEYPDSCRQYSLCSDNCYINSYYYRPEFKDDPEEYECDCKIPSITKEDLTIKWLFKECICNRFSGELPIHFSDNDAKEYCLEYKCNDYLIEVKK